jgi:cold shock protein
LVIERNKNYRIGRPDKATGAMGGSKRECVQDPARTPVNRTIFSPVCFWAGYGALFVRDLRLGLSSIYVRFPGAQCKHSTATRLFVAAPDLRAASAFWRSSMTIGTVKFFNATKGFGFIAPESGEKDVFVHVSAVEQAGLGTLAEGQRVSFDVVTERGKLAASNLKAA